MYMIYTYVCIYLYIYIYTCVNVRMQIYENISCSCTEWHVYSSAILCVPSFFYFSSCSAVFDLCMYTRIHTDDHKYMHMYRHIHSLTHT